MNKRVFVFWSIFISIALIRFFYSFGHDSLSAHVCVKYKISGTGVVSVEPERKESGQIYTISVREMRAVSLGTTTLSDPIDCGVDLLIRAKSKLYPRFKYGDNISFTGTLSQPFNFKSDSGRSFDYRGYLAKDDIHYEIKSATAQTISSNEYRVGTVPSLLLFLRRSFVSNLEKVLGEPHGALAAGLVVGEKSALGKDLLEAFRVVGLIHIVVLSGYNITIVGDAMRRALTFLPRSIGIITGGIGIALFGVLVGGGATVVRSCFMASVALSADLIRRDYDVVRALLFAGLIMIIQNPKIFLHDPSFQLSFLATLGLILLAKPIENILPFVPEKFGMRGIVACTVATQIFVSPFILYMMGQISIVGTIVNILVLPVIPATMLFVFLTGAIGFIWLPLAHVTGWIAHGLLSYELFMVDIFARAPYASLSVPTFSFWWVVGFYVLFGVIYWMVSRDFIDKVILYYRRKRLMVLYRRRQLINTSHELLNIPKDFVIPDPDRLLYIGMISSRVALKIDLTVETEVYISMRSLKHIIERRKYKAIETISLLPEAICYPSKITDNSAKRLNSYLFVVTNRMIVCVVVEKTKTTQRCQVVSAFPISRKTYKKMVDISGRAEFPPFELPS